MHFAFNLKTIFHLSSTMHYLAIYGHEITAVIRS